MVKIMILEDNEESLAILAEIVRQLSLEIKLFLAKDLGEAREIIRHQRDIALFLLDINLNEKRVEDVGGMEFAKEVRDCYEYELVTIVFVTSILSMELSSYREVQCYQYITKPYEKEQVHTIIKKILNHAGNEEKEFILIKKDGVNYKIVTDDIIYIQAVPRGIRIFLKKEEVEVKYLSLKQILPKLPPKKFIQCHRMFIVNRNCIEYIDAVNRMIKLIGRNLFIEIGVTYKAKVKEWIHE